MNTKIIAALVALAAILTYAETVQEPLVETHQGSAKKVVPDGIECHNGSLKKPKDAVNCHHGSVKQPGEKVNRDSNADRGGLSAPVPEVPKAE